MEATLQAWVEPFTPSATTLASRTKIGDQRSLHHFSMPWRSQGLPQALGLSERRGPKSLVQLYRFGAIRAAHDLIEGFAIFVLDLLEEEHIELVEGLTVFLDGC